MKLLEIPENTNELRDYNKFINTIVEVQKFNNNVTSFLKQVLYDEFFKTVEDWKKILSEEDIIKLNNTLSSLKINFDRRFNLSRKIDKRKIWIKETESKEAIKAYKFDLELYETELKKLEIEPFFDTWVFYDYEINNFIIPLPHEKARKKINFLINSDIKTIKPSNCGLKITVKFKRSYKEFAWPTDLPTYHSISKYEIDLIKKSIKLIDTDLTETSNKLYR